MPLPKAGDKQTTERLEALYDQCALIAYEAIMKPGTPPLGILSINPHIPEEVAKMAYTYATAMLNERNKK